MAVIDVWATARHSEPLAAATRQLEEARRPYRLVGLTSWAVLAVCLTLRAAF